MSQLDLSEGTVGQPVRGRIGVVIEEHFDGHEFQRFNEFFPQHGYQVVYLSHLWDQPHLTFHANPHDGHISHKVRVTHEIAHSHPGDFAGVILIGGYAMDRLRYQTGMKPGEASQAPAVQFLRKAVVQPNLWIGTICHSLWLYCADPTLLMGRQVTCAHNIACDVVNAGGKLVYEGDQLADIAVDGHLISGRHPGVVEEFMHTFLQHLNS